MAREETWQQQWLKVAREVAPAGDKGRIYAVHFANFLKWLMREGVISDWRETGKDLLEDGEGVDFWVAVEGERFGLGITSTRQNAQQRIKKHPGVYNLWLRSGSEDGFRFKPDEQLRKELTRGVEWYRDMAARGEVMFGYRHEIG